MQLTKIFLALCSRQRKYCTNFSQDASSGCYLQNTKIVNEFNVLLEEYVLIGLKISVDIHKKKNKRPALKRVPSLSKLLSNITLN